MKRVLPMFTCFLPLAFGHKRRNSRSSSNDSAPQPHPLGGVPRSLPCLCAPEPSAQLAGSDSAAQLAELYGDGGPASAPASQPVPADTEPVSAERRSPSEAPASEGNSNSYSNPLVSEELVRCPSRPSPRRTPLSRRSRRTMRRLRSLVPRSARLRSGGGDSDSSTSSNFGVSGRTCVDDSRRVGSEAATNRSRSRTPRSNADDSRPLLDGSVTDSSDDSSFDDEHSDADEDDEDAEICILDTLDSQKPGRLRPRRRRTRPKTPSIPFGDRPTSGSAAATSDIDLDITPPTSQSNALYSKDRSVELDLGTAAADAAALLGDVTGGAGSPVLPQVPPAFGTALHPLQPNESLSTPSSTEDSLLRLSLNVSSSSATGSHSSYAASPLQPSAAHPNPLVPNQLATDSASASASTAHAPTRPYGRSAYPNKATPGIWAPLHRGVGRGGAGMPLAVPRQVLVGSPPYPPSSSGGHHMYRRMSPGGMPQLQLMQWQHHMSGAEASVVSSASNTSSPITTPRSSMSHPQHLASFGSWLHPAGSVMSPSLITDTPDVSARYSINDSDVLRNNLTSGLSSHESATVMQTDSLALFMESAVLPMPTDAIDESAFDDTVNGATAAAAATSTNIGKHHNVTTFAHSTFAASSAQSESMFAVGDAAHTRTRSDPLTSRSKKSTAEKLETLSFSNELVVATFGSPAAPSKTKDTLMVSVQPPIVVKRRPGTPEVSDGGTKPSAATVEISSALKRALSTGGASLNLFPAENQVGEVVDLAPAGAKSPSVSLQPQAACPPLSTQSSSVLSQNSVDASIAVATGDDADTKHTGDGEFRIQSPPAPSFVSSTHATIDPALLATKLEDSESANLLETALAMAGGKVSSPTAGAPAIAPSPHAAATRDGGLHVAMPKAKPWPQILPPSPYRNSASAKYGAGSANAKTNAPITSQQSDHESGVRCAVCKYEEAAGGCKGRVRALPEDLCRGSGGLCDECSGKVVSEARSVMVRGMHFLCPCSCGQRWTQSPMSHFASLASRTPLPVPLPPLAPSDSSICEPPSESDASDDSCSLNSSPAEPPTTPMPRMLSFTSSPSRSPIATPLALPGVPELNPINASTPSPPPSPPPRAPSASPDSRSSAQALCSAAAAAAASVLRRPNSLHRNRSLGQLHLDLSFRLPTLDNPSRSTSLPTTPEREAASNPSPSFAALGSDSHRGRGSNPSASRRLTHSRSHPTLSSPHGSTSSGEFPSAPLQPPAALLVGGGLPTPRFGPPAAATSAAPATAHSLAPPQHATPVDTPPEAVQTAPTALTQSQPMSMSPPPSPPPPSTRPLVHQHVHKMQAASKLATVRLPPRPRSIPMPPSSTTSTSVPPTHMQHASRSGSHIPHAPRSFMFQPSQDEARQSGAARWEAAVNAVRGYSAPPCQPRRRSSNGSASSSTIKQTRGQQQPCTGTRSEDSQPRRELHMPRTRHVFRAPVGGSNRTAAAHTRSTSTGSAGRRHSSSSQKTINTAQPTMLDSLDGAPADGPVAESATCRTPRHFHTATTSKDVTRAAAAAARAAHHVALSCMPKEDPRTPPPRRSTERHLWHTNPVALPPTAPPSTPPTDPATNPPRSRSTRSLQKLLSLPASALQCVKGGPMSPGAGDALTAMTDFSLLNSTEHGYPEGPSVMSQGCAGKSSGVVSLDACSASMKRDQTDTLPLQALLAMEDSDSSMGACNPQRQYNNPKARVPAHSNPSHSRSRRRSGASTNSPSVRGSRTYTAPSEALLQSIVDECWAAATASGHLHHLVGRSSSTDTLGGGPSAADKDFLSQCAALEEALCRTSDSSRMSRSPSLSASRAMSGSLMRQSSRQSLRQSCMHGHSNSASASLAAVPSGASTSMRSSSHTRMRTR